MLDTELMTPPPPTPFEVLKVLTEVYGPPSNPDNPFQDTKKEALVTLATQMLFQAHEGKDPIAQLAQIWLSHQLQPCPSEDEAHSRFTTATALCKEIQQDLELAYENAQ